MSESAGESGGTGAQKAKSKRGRLSTSPIARPSALIHSLASRVQDYLYFPSPDPLYVVLGTIAANMLQGTQVWVMLVGAPSSGKTVMLETLTQIPQVHVVGVVKGPAAFLSGVATKDKASNATGGLLRKIGGRGMMVVKDFTSILDMPREPRGETVTAFREVYDGRYTRSIGTEGGKTLEWQGRVGFLGASTPAIDTYSAVTSALGERWIYYRYQETDGYGETIKALTNRDQESMTEDLRSLIAGFMETLGLNWGCSLYCQQKHEHRPPQEKRELTDYERNRIYTMASITCASRSMVPRDPKTQEIIGVAEKEAPTRVAGALGQLYLGLEAIGLENAECWGIVGRMALDSAPTVRVKALLTLKGVQWYAGDPKGHGLTVAEVQKVLGCSMRYTMITLEDLHVHGLVELAAKRARNDKTEQVVRLTEYARKQFELGWAKEEKAKEEQ